MAEDQTGVIVLVLGILFMGLSVVLFPLTLPFCGLGLILLIIGIIMIATQPSRQPYYPAPAYPYPPAYPGQPGVAAPAPPAPVAASCPVCGGPLTWVSQYGRWYCYRCQAYR